jgi:hypothetical protein
MTYYLWRIYNLLQYLDRDIQQIKYTQYRTNSILSSMDNHVLALNESVNSLNWSLGFLTAIIVFFCLFNVFKGRFS